MTLAAITGPFLSDGTLLKPVAVDTTVEDGSDLLRTYKVKSGDTLTGIAAKFDVSMMTLWWANDLNSKDELHLGQVLTIPPMSGLVLTVTANDTLDTLAAKYKVDKADIVDDQRPQGPEPRGRPGPRGARRQGQADPDPQAGQAPGRQSARAPAAAVAARPARPPATPVAASSGRSSVAATTSASTSTTATTRSTSRLTTGRASAPAAAGPSSGPAGRATAAATRSGSPTAQGCTRRTTTCPRSRSGVASTSGVASRSAGSASPATPPGPHLHFEVWRGPVWDGGTRVNPLGYL